MANENARNLAGIVAELKDELKDFVQTRFEMLRSELRDKVKAWKLVLPLMASALLLLGTAWLVLTAALISIVATAFYPSRFAYFFAFVIVGVAYGLGGMVFGSFALRDLKEKGVVPVRTIKVLKQDQVWLQTEARTQI